MISKASWKTTLYHEEQDNNPISKKSRNATRMDRTVEDALQEIEML
jgi:hypothetical protein